MPHCIETTFVPYSWAFALAIAAFFRGWSCAPEQAVLVQMFDVSRGKDRGGPSYS